MSAADILRIYIDILDFALPVAIIFGICNLIVNIILTAAFTGRLDLSGRGRYF